MTKRTYSDELITDVALVEVKRGGMNRLSHSGKVTGYLLDLIDDALGPDVCIVVAIGIHGLTGLTTYEEKKKRIVVASTPAFEARFGAPFRVEFDRKEVEWLRLDEMYAIHCKPSGP